jgi:Organic solute transporter Ostalpha
LIDIFITGGAVGAVIKFYAHPKEINPKYHPLARLIAFNGIVIFQFLQEIIFGFLDGKIFELSKTMAYDDIYYGVPMMLTAIEAITFYFTFHFAFRSREYYTDNRLETHWLST